MKRGGEPKVRYAEIEEAMICVLRFPEERLAAFTCSFGDVSSYRTVGTSRVLRVEPAYEYAGALTHHLTVDGRTRKRTFPRRDQFAPELLHFSSCIRDDEEPERGVAVDLLELEGDRPPRPRQARRLPPVEKSRLVHAKSAGR